MKKFLIVLTLILSAQLIVPTLYVEGQGDKVSDVFGNEDMEENEEEAASNSEADSSHQPNEANMSDQQETGGNDQNILNSNPPSLPRLVIQLVVVLGIIIALIYGLLKFFNRSGQFSKQGDVLENLGGISLGTNKSAQMLRIGDRIYLVGVGDNIELLTEITDASIKDQILASHEQKNGQVVNPIQSLFHLKKQPKQANENNQKHDQPFASLFKSELDALKEKRKQMRLNDKDDDNT
ncbi:flagellar biosynthetic protein FliO [Amphibacillus sediminis]|uniref:flagellar biosynthetic protein FliO n=1 Tax=Amphibacillus sediminis TaxID=360185 RepID=UPI00082D51B3|nr:flagellar biosynthetic protein FliO [Amphibacillus sediminis]